MQEARPRRASLRALSTDAVRREALVVSAEWHSARASCIFGDPLQVRVVCGWAPEVTEDEDCMRVVVLVEAPGWGYLGFGTVTAASRPMPVIPRPAGQVRCAEHCQLVAPC